MKIDMSRLVRLFGLTVMVFFLSLSVQAFAQESPLPPSDHSPVNTDIATEKAAPDDKPDGMKDSKMTSGSRLWYPGCGVPIEYGKPLDRSPDDSSGQWEFTMGSMF